MKNLSFIIFFSIVLVIYGLINFYIYYRGSQSIVDSQWKTYFRIFFIFIASSYILSRFMQVHFINSFTNTLHWIGSFWLGIMVYLLLIILFIDILRLLNLLINFHPDFIYADIKRTKIVLFSAISFLVITIAGIGYYNTINSRIKTLNIFIDKKANGLNQLKLALVSDVHLGITINKNRTEYLVKKINSLNPDIIVIAGDLLDEDTKPVLKYNIGSILTKLKAPYGIYAITGNHEYIGKINKTAKYIEDHGIKLIRDSAICINNQFWLIGREDKDKERFTGIKRKRLKDIMTNVTTKNLPLILLDHQPFNLFEAENEKIDLQFSGHTHHSQIWPLNYLTQKIYEKDWGYLKKNNTHYYISCGFGTWGPPMRIGSKSEIINVIINFKN